TGKEVRTFSRGWQDLGELALSADGKMLFSLSSKGLLRIEDVASGAQLRQWQFPGFDIMAAHLTLSPAGSVIALARRQNRHLGRLFVWNWRTNEEPRELASPLLWD